MSMSNSFAATGPISKDSKGIFREEMSEVADLIQLRKAQTTFNVDGTGSCIAVLDSGLRGSHKAFAGRVEKGLDVLSGNPIVPQRHTDPFGHGTHVSGIAVAQIWLDRETERRNLSGMAPGAKIFPIKVLNSAGRTSPEVLEAAYSWLANHALDAGISVVCMSITDENNHQSIPEAFLSSSINSDIQELVTQNIPVVMAAGNFYKTYGSNEGMGYPAILPQVISVGSVYDEDVGPTLYPSDDGAACSSTEADQITPYSQRFSPTGTSPYGTTIMAPGGIVTSTGHESDLDIEPLDGTSQATPVVAGLIALLQQAYGSWHRVESRSATLLSVDQITEILQISADRVRDEDLGRSNVSPTGKSFLRVNALESVRVAYELGRLAVS